VPLEAVAKAITEHAVGQRNRIDGLAAVSIKAEVDKGITSPEAVVADLQKVHVPQLQTTHPRIRVQFGGEAEELELVMDSMREVVSVALIIVYALLAVVLKRYFAPLIILAVIPFGVAGAVFGHLVHGLAFSILSLFGVMALSGVVINDSLLLVARYLELRPGQPSTHAAVVAASRERFRAILLTSVTTYVGLIPLMANPSMQAAFLKPAAASLAYGVLFGTVITLVLVPALILIGDDLQRLLRRRTATAEVST
jgi:multidrug efflux pump subunit AcrB